MTTHLALIANPAAGGGRCGQRLDDAVRRLSSPSCQVEVYKTTAPGHATTLAQQLWEQGHRTLIIAGGDGTTFEVTSGLLQVCGEQKPVLGLLPLGTGNSFLHDYQIDNADQAIAAILAGRKRPADAVKTTLANGTSWHYVNLLSMGFTSAVGALTNRRFKAFGAAGYALATVVEVARLQATPIPYSLGDSALDTRPYSFLSFSNSSCTGGRMKMAPHADTTDGLLDLVRVGPLSRLDLLRTFPKLYAGRHLEHPRVDVVRTASVRFALQGPVDCMVDGEVISAQPTRLDCIRHAIEVLS